MERRSIAQEYFVLVMDENGNMPVMRKSESNAGMVAAGFMDLLLNGIVKMEKKKITVIEAIPDELGHLGSLYAYLSAKPRSTEKLMSDYIVSTSARIRQLTADVGESLAADSAVKKEKGGLFGNKIMFIPEKNYKEELISIIKTAVADEDEISLHDLALICILKETKNLKQYFSKYESDKLKAKLKEMKKNPQSKQLVQMINYVNDMTAIMVAVILTTNSI